MYKNILSPFVLEEREEKFRTRKKNRRVCIYMYRLEKDTLPELKSDCACREEKTYIENWKREV